MGKNIINFNIGGLSNAEILSGIAEIDEELAESIINLLMEKRKEIYDQIESEPLNYATWLFVNQGERLFANNNRLLIILASEQTLKKPWWMKSNFLELKEKINNFLNSDLTERIFELTYRYNKTPEFEGKYNALAGLILIREKCT